jgi:hypothetical protein
MKTFNFFCEKLESWAFEKIARGRPLRQFLLPISIQEYFVKE